MSKVANFFAKTAVSAARSLILSEVKGTVKGFLNKKRAKTIQDVHQEMMGTIGYISPHYHLNKNQEIVYKSSAVFFHEWLTNSPLVKEKFFRDEETGKIFSNIASNRGHEIPITNTEKLNLLNRFIASTGVKTASLSSHMEQAFKLIELSDITARKFRTHFAGWNQTNPSIIDGWLANCFGDILETDLTYANLLFRKWVVGTAKRAISPGSSFDGALLLTGPKGTGKTGFFRNLLPEPFNGRTGEIFCNVKSPQKFVESIRGKTIACFDELSVLEYASSTEIFKQLLSSQNIDVRLAWAREPKRYALRQGFCATTNKDKFIPDDALSRRLWTIKLNDKGRLNFDYLLANRTELWKEAVYLAENNASCMLSVEEQKIVENHNKTYML